MAYRKGLRRPARRRKQFRSWNASSNASGTRNEGFSLPVVTSGGNVPGTAFAQTFSPLDQDYTILRTRGIWSLTFNDLQTSEPDEPVLVTVGMGVVSQAAADALALPSPLSQADWDGWWYHDSMIFPNRSTIATSLEPIGNFQQIKDIDSKAMRRVETGNTIFVAAQAQNVGATSAQASAFQVSMYLRLLLKNPS